MADDFLAGLKQTLAARPLVVIFVVAYTVLTIRAIDDAAALQAAPVWTLQVSPVALPLPAGSTELPAANLSISLGLLFYLAPLLLLLLQLLAVGDLRSGRVRNWGSLGTLYVFLPLLALVYVMRKFAPLAAAQPVESFISGGNVVLVTGVHALAIVAAATVLFNCGKGLGAAAAVLVVAAFLAALPFMAVMASAEVLEILGVARDERVALPVISLALGALVLLGTSAASRLTGPFGFRPWMPLAPSAWNARRVRHPANREDRRMIRIVAPFVLLLVATLGVAAPSFLDLSGRTLAANVPAVAPEPAMVIAYAAEKRDAQDAWLSAEQHAWRRARGLMLDGFRLDRARFTGSELYRVDLSRASLRGATFDGARIFRGRLVGACIAGASFRGADLTLAEFGSAGYRTGDAVCGWRVAEAHGLGGGPTASDQPPRVDFSGAKLHFVRFPTPDGREIPEMGDGVQCGDDVFGFPHISLNEAELHYSDLRCRDLSDVPMRDAEFDGADLRGSSLPDFCGRLTETGSQSETEAEGVASSEAERAAAEGEIPAEGEVVPENQELPACDQTPRSFQRADLRGVVLRGDLSFVDFRGADLRGANISQANLTGALFACALIDYDTLGANGTVHLADLTTAFISPANGEAARTRYKRAQDEYREALRKSPAAKITDFLNVEDALSATKSWKECLTRGGGGD